MHAGNHTSRQLLNDSAWLVEKAII